MIVDGKMNIHLIKIDSKTKNNILWKREKLRTADLVRSALDALHKRVFLKSYPFTQLHPRVHSKKEKRKPVS